jgi:hypothetical protein
MMLVWMLVIAAVLFDAYVPIYLMVTVVVILGWFYSGWKVYIPVILLGLIYDLTMARPLGLTSIILLIMAGGLVIARQQFEWTSGVFVILVGVLAELMMGLYLGNKIVWWSLLWQGLVVGGLWWVITKIRTKEGVYLR